MDLRRPGSTRTRPAQMELTFPQEDGEDDPGTRHAQVQEDGQSSRRNGKTCHAYCTYGFRWPQFVGDAGPALRRDRMPAPGPVPRGPPDVTDV